MVGFSFRILSSQHRLISSHLNKTKLSSCRWRVSKRIQILFCFNVDGCFLKGRVANWVEPVFSSRRRRQHSRVCLRLKGINYCGSTRPRQLTGIFPVSLGTAGLRLVPNPKFGKKNKKNTLRVSDGELIVCFRTCL